VDRVIEKFDLLKDSKCREFSNDLDAMLEGSSRAFYGNLGRRQLIGDLTIIYERDKISWSSFK